MPPPERQHPAPPPRLVPHFAVRLRDGRPVRYGDVWQRRHLVLVLLAGSHQDEALAEALEPARASLEALDCAVLVTYEAIDGFPRPGVVIADRWGEVQHVHAATTPPGDDFPPSVEAIQDWVRYLQTRCPECEGEAL